MTVVAGAIGGKSVSVATDSWGVLRDLRPGMGIDHTLYDNLKKLFVLGSDVVVGGTGYEPAFRRLEASLQGDRGPDGRPYEWLGDVLGPAFLAAYKPYEWLFAPEDWKSLVATSDLLVGLVGADGPELWSCDVCGPAIRHGGPDAGLRQYAATGSGCRWAVGSLATTARFDMSPDERVRLAVEVASAHSISVGGRVQLGSVTAGVESISHDGP